jgi:hypothetical protein
MGSAPAGTALGDVRLAHPPHQQGWFDTFADWVEALPGPAWITYFLLWVWVCLSLVGFQWAHSGREVLPNLPYLIFFASQSITSLAMAHAIRAASSRSFERFRPLLDDGEEHVAAHKYTLARAPVRSTMIASLATAGVLPVVMILSDVSQPLRLNVVSLTSWTLLLIGLVVNGFVVGGTLYHLLYQLRAIHRLLVSAKPIDLNDLEPAYAFSSTTSLAALMLTLDNTLWYAIQPALLTDPFGVVAGIVMSGLALVVFIWPLWGAHRLLQREQVHLLKLNGAAFQRLRDELHSRARDGSFEGMGDLHHALSSLEVERARLDRVPTWPWHPGTFRGTLAAILLPIVIWLIQQILSQWLGGP